MVKVAKLLAVLALLASASTSIAIAQQVANPPEDRRPFLTIFTHAQYRGIPHEAELVAAFEDDPNLRQVRSQCRWNHYTPEDDFYKARLAKLIPRDRFPAILLQRADGGYVYKSTGSNVPDSATDIFDEMAHFAKLDPLTGPADSTEARPYSAWHVITQSGLDGVPDRDGPPGQDCPDGKCPLPNDPEPEPDGDGLRPIVTPADSAELLGTRQPIRNMTAAAVLIVGVIGGGGLLLCFGVAFLGLVYLVVRFTR